MDRNTNSGLISVIIPVYNVEKYLPISLESIIDQSYSNLEILLVNDGSTDSSAQICNWYAAKDSRIKIIHQSNSGPALARNTGLAYATGDYISFVDSDDFIQKDFYFRLYSAMLETESDMVQCNNYVVDEDGNRLEGLQTDPTSGEYTGYECLQTLYEHDFRPKNIILWNKLYKKELWKDIELPIGSLHDDEYALPYIYDRVQKVTIIPEQLHSYRVRTGSIMNTPDVEYQIKKQLDINQIYGIRYKFFKSKGYLVLAEATLKDKINWLRSVSKTVKQQDWNRAKKKMYFKQIQKDIRIYLKDYLKSNNISKHRKFKFICYYLGLFI